MKDLLASVLLLITANGQYECFYRRGLLELDLTPYKGKQLHFNGNNGHYFYSVCENSLTCVRESVQNLVMLDYYPNGVNECLDVAEFDPNVIPFFDAFIGSWIFNYTGGPCPDTKMQEKRSATVVWNCNPDAPNAHIHDVFHYNECNDWVQIEWEGACQEPPPANLHCEFKSPLPGGPSLNLSSIQGTVFSYTDTNNHRWNLSPCANSLTCNGPNGVRPNMADIEDTSGQCAKFFAVWSGDDFPIYEHNPFGENFWQFYWMNGQECSEGGPAELTEVRYYCGNTTNTILAYAGPKVQPCQFEYKVYTPLACPQNEYGKPILHQGPMKDFYKPF